MRPFLLSLALLAAPGCGPDAPRPDAATPPPPPSTSPTALAERLPDTIAGRDRQSLDQGADAALGAEVTQVSAEYGDVTLSITDYGTAEMTRMMGHGWALEPGVEQLDGLPVQRDGGTVRVLAAGRVLAEATAPTAAEAEQGLASVRLDGLP